MLASGPRAAVMDSTKPGPTYTAASKPPVHCRTPSGTPDPTRRPETMKIFHNPRCSKSREALALLQEAGQAPEVIEYLKTPPDLGTLKALVRQLGLPVRELLRSSEAAYAELGLADPALSDDQLLDALLHHPQLLQRPIVVRGEQALIARPPERLRDWL